MSSSPHRVVQGIEWLPCCMGIGFNLYRAYREDQAGRGPNDFTHRQQGLYLVYGMYQLGSLAGAVQGLTRLLE
ncbi:hypothetical protein EXS73_02305 [Candidatus Pacearchaeota archaeon]|nr:hypothetical protein [Candidatus Pacearchaeota archaeon]